jgi:hypothetical protein
VIDAEEIDQFWSTFTLSRRYRMSTLDEITKEKQRLSEALAGVDAQREKLTGQLSELEATERVLAPPPTQSPLTAATIGFEYGSFFSKAWLTIRATSGPADRSPSRVRPPPLRCSARFRGRQWARRDLRGPAGQRMKSDRSKIYRLPTRPEPQGVFCPPLNLRFSDRLSDCPIDHPPAAR